MPFGNGDGTLELLGEQFLVVTHGVCPRVLS